MVLKPYVFFFSLESYHYISLTIGMTEVCPKLLQMCLTLTTLWTVARQAPLSRGFSMQEYWNGLPCPSPGDLLYPGIEPKSLALQADSLPSETPLDGRPKPICYSSQCGI